MSIKVSDLLFEENSSENIHKIFENNTLNEAELPEAKLKMVGKKIAQQISAVLPDAEIMLKDPESGVFDLKSLKLLSQKNLAGFTANFISSKVSKTEDGVEGKQNAPTPLDMKNFEKFHVYPLIIEDKKTGENIEGGKSGETYFMLYFIPSIGEVIKDANSIKLHKYLFGIQENIKPDEQGIIHFDIKELPHFPATFEMIQAVQKAFMSGNPIGFKDLFIKKTQLKSTGQGEEKPAAQDEVKPAEQGEDQSGEQGEKVPESVYESARKGSLHKQDLSMLLFEKKSRLTKEEKLVLNEALLLEDKEALNEFVKEFLKNRKRKKSIKSANKSIEKIRTLFYNKFSTTREGLPDNFDDIIKAGLQKSPDEVLNLFNYLKNIKTAELEKEFNFDSKSKDGQGRGEAAKRLLTKFIKDAGSAADVNYDEEDFEKLSSSFTSTVSVSLSTDDESEEDDIVSKINNAEKSSKASEKDVKKFFDSEGRIAESERLDVEASIKETLTKYKSSIPESCKELKELFSGKINLDKISEAANNIVSLQNTRVQELTEAMGESKDNADKMLAMLRENVPDSEDFIKPIVDNISKSLKENNESTSNLIKAFSATIEAGKEINKEINNIKAAQVEGRDYDYKGSIVSLKDPLAGNVIVMITAGVFVEYSKYCYTLLAACDEVAVRIGSSFDNDFYEQISEMITAEVEEYNASLSGEGEEVDEKEQLKKQQAQELKLSELSAIFRVQNSLSKFGISSKEARELLSISSSEPEQISSAVMEAISISPKKKSLNEATTTKASNPNIVAISGKVLVNFDGTLNRPVLKSMFDTLDKQNAFRRLKQQIQDDLLAITGTKVFKDVDEETLQDLLHSYFMSEFSNAGDIATSLSSHPGITRAKMLVSATVKSGVSKAKASLRVAGTMMKEGFVWALSSLKTLVGVGLATVLGYGGLKILTSVFSSVKILSPLAAITGKMVAALGVVYTKLAGLAGISTGVAGVITSGTALMGLYNAVIGQYLGTATLAATDPLLNFMYQAIAYPLGGIKTLWAAKSFAISSVFSWQRYWDAMTAGAVPVKAAFLGTAKGKAAIAASKAVGSAAFHSVTFSGGTLAAATGASIAAEKASLSAAVVPAVAKGFMTTGFWGPIIVGAIATYASYRLIKWLASEGKEKDVKVGEVIGEMLKLYVLSTAANCDPDKVANYLGLSNPADRSLMSQKMQPTQNEIQLVTEFINLPAKTGFLGRTDTKSFTEYFNDVNKAADQKGAMDAFRKALDVFEDIFDILSGSSKHGRDTSTASDWFKTNNTFNDYTLSKSVDVRAFTVNKLRDLLKEFNADLILIQSGAVSVDDFKAHYADGALTRIVAAFLKGNGDEKSQTLARSRAFDLVSTKEDIATIIEKLREQQLNSMTTLFKGTPKFNDDPLLKILATIKDKPDIESFDGLQINLSNIIKKIDAHVPQDSIDVDAIIKTLKSKAGGMTHGVISKYFLKGNRVMQAIKGVMPLTENEQQKYAKEFSEEIAQVLSKSMQYCVDPVNLFAESKHPIYVNHIPNQGGLLTETSWFSKAGLATLGAGAGVGAYSYVKGVSAVQGATALSNLAMSGGASAVASLGLTGAKAAAVTFGIQAGIIILSLVATYGMAKLLWTRITRLFASIKDKIDSGRYFNPWEDSSFVKEIRPLIVKAGQAQAAEKYMGVIFALKSKLEKIGVKVTGFNDPAFKDLNTRLKNAKQISAIKNNLTSEGDKLRDVFRENMYHVKASLPREGLGKYLNDSTVDAFLDDILFGTNSPLQEIFKHKSMSDSSSDESFVYQKGLGLLLEEESKDKKITISMSEIYTKLADRVEEYFKANLNYNERITVDIQEPLDDLMRDWIGGRVAGKLGRLGQAWKGKTGADYLVDAISQGTGLPKNELVKFMKTQGVKVFESKNSQGDLLLEALYTQKLSLLVESDKINYVFSKGKDVKIYGMSDVKGGTGSIYTSADGGATWGIERSWNGKDPTSTLTGFKDVTTDPSTPAMLQKLKSTYTTGVRGPTASGGMTAVGGEPMGGFDPVLAPAASASSASWLTGFLTPAITNKIVAACANVFTIMWQVDGACALILGLFDDTLHIGKTMDMLNKINWSAIPSKMFLASTIITLDAIREDLAKRGIEIQGNVPTDVLSNFDAASSTGAGNSARQQADIVSQEILDKMGIKDSKQNKVKIKQIKRAVESSLNASIIAYYKQFSRDKYDERIKRAELGADVNKRRSAVHSRKNLGAGLAIGLVGLGAVLGGPIGAAVGAKIGAGGALLGTGAASALGITGLFAGSKVYNSAEDSRIDQLYASGEEFDSEVTKAEKAMAAKEASQLADLLITLSKEVKGIKSETYQIKNNNLLNIDYVHNTNSLTDIISETSRLLAEVDTAFDTVAIEDVLKKLRASGIMVFNGDIKRGTEDYKEALSHTVETVESLLASYFDIKVTGAEKYKSNNFVQNVVKSAVNTEAKPGESASPMIAQAADGTSPGNMNAKGNMNDMMQLANMSGGNNMMMFMMMMMMSMSGRNQGGFDIMQLMQQLNGGKVTVGEAAERISEEEGMEGFADAIKLAITESNASKPAMSSERLKRVFKTMNKNPLSASSAWDIRKDVRKGSKIDAKLFVEKAQRSLNITEKAETSPTDLNVVKGFINVLSDIFTLSSDLADKDLKDNNLFVIRGNKASRKGPGRSIMGSYYLKLIGSPGKSFTGDKGLKFNSDTEIEISNEYFKSGVSSTTVITLDKKTVDALKSTEKFLEKDFVAESIRVKSYSDDLITETFYKDKLSSLLFEEKTTPVKKLFSKKTKSSKDINLRQEWLNIWDI